MANSKSRARGEYNLLKTYVCTEPVGKHPPVADYDYVDDEETVSTLKRSVDYFSNQERSRTVEWLSFEIAHISMLHGWFLLIEEVDQILKKCAQQKGDVETLVAVEWELLCHHLNPRSDRDYDFVNCLIGVESLNVRPRVTTSSKHVLSPISATFAFTVANGHVGEVLPFQIVVTSLAHQMSRPLTLSHLLLAFTSGLRSVEIRHDSHVGYESSVENGLVHFYAPLLRKEASGTLQGTCNLEISPGSTKVITLTALPLDAGEIKVSKISLCMEEEHFEFEHSISGSDYLNQPHLWTADGNISVKGEPKPGRSTIVEILPKPPKIRIELPNILKVYFTGEHVSIDIQVRNEEDEEANVNIEVNFLDQADPAPVLRWAATLESKTEAADQNQSGCLKTSLGVIPPSEARSLTVKFQAKPETAQCTLDIQCRYFLLSDPETPVSKAVSVDMHFMRPFEANFDYVPQVQDKPLSNYFHISAAEGPGHLGSRGAGTTEPEQRWAATAAIASFASTDLTIEAVDLQLATAPQKAACHIMPEVDSSSVAATISPHSILKRQFLLDLHQLSFEDQQTTYFDLQLRITWQRDIPDASSAIAILPLPELVASFGEPRVLASASQDNIPLNTIYLDYLVENPSMHVLSFNITMEANEDFAFSGPKATSVQLIPYSHHFIRYTLLPLVRGKAVYPQIKIVDVVWNKMLKVHASRGMRSDKRGISIWIDPEG